MVNIRQSSDNEFDFFFKLASDYGISLNNPELNDTDKKKLVIDFEKKLVDIVFIYNEHYIQHLDKLLALAINTGSTLFLKQLLNQHFILENNIFSFEEKKKIGENFYQIMIRYFSETILTDQTEIAGVLLKECKNNFLENTKKSENSIESILNYRVGRGWADGEKFLNFLEVYSLSKKLGLMNLENDYISEYFSYFFKEKINQSDMVYLEHAFTFKEEIQKLDFYNKDGEHILHFYENGVNSLSHLVKYLIHNNFKSMAELFEAREIESNFFVNFLMVELYNDVYENCVKETLAVIHDKDYPISYKDELCAYLEDWYLGDAGQQVQDFNSFAKKNGVDFLAFYNKSIYSKMLNLISQYAISPRNDLKEIFKKYLSLYNYFSISKEYRGYYSFHLAHKCIQFEAHDLLVELLHTDCCLFLNGSSLLDYAASMMNILIYNAVESKIKSNPEKYAYLAAQIDFGDKNILNLHFSIYRASNPNIPAAQKQKALDFAKMLLTKHKEYYINAISLCGDSLGNLLFFYKKEYTDEVCSDICETAKKLGISVSTDFNVRQDIFSYFVNIAINRKDIFSLVQALKNDPLVKTLKLYSRNGQTVYDACKQENTLEQVAQRLINNEFLNFIDFANQSDRNLDVLVDYLYHSDINSQGYQNCMNLLINIFCSGEVIDKNFFGKILNDFNNVFEAFFYYAISAKRTSDIIFALEFHDQLKKIGLFSLEGESLYNICKQKNDLDHVANQLINGEFYSIFQLMKLREIDEKNILSVLDFFEDSEQNTQLFLAEIIVLVNDKTQSLHYREFLLRTLQEIIIPRITLSTKYELEIFLKLEKIKKEKISTELILNIFSNYRQSFFHQFMRYAPQMVFSNQQKEIASTTSKEEIFLIEKIATHVVYNNDYYLPANQWFVDGPSKTFAKGGPLFWNGNPIGYNVFLPLKDISNVLFIAYGGGAAIFEPDMIIDEYYQYLLDNGIAIISLNLPDLIELKVYQGQMPEALNQKIHACIEHAREIFQNNPQSLNITLSGLKDAKMMFYGGSFGGRTVIRHAELYPDSFDGFISHNGSLSSDMIIKSDMFAQHALKSTRVLNDYLDPSQIEEMHKIKKPLLLLHNMDDNNVNVKVSLDFYNKMISIGKGDLVKLHITNSGNELSKTLINKGHFLPQAEDLSSYAFTVIDFIFNGPSLLSSLSQWRGFKRDIQANQFYKHATICEKFVSEAMDIRHLKKQKDNIDEAWEKDYLPIYQRVFYVEQMMRSPTKLRKEINRLMKNSVLTDTMILKTLRTQYNAFSQYANIAIADMFSIGYSGDPLYASLEKRLMLSEFKKLLYSLNKKDKKLIEYLLLSLYKDNPALLEPISSTINQMISSDEYKFAKDALNTAVSKNRKLIANLFMEAARKEKTRLQSTLGPSDISPHKISKKHDKDKSNKNDFKKS